MDDKKDIQEKNSLLDEINILISKKVSKSHLESIARDIYDACGRNNSLFQDSNDGLRINIDNINVNIIKQVKEYLENVIREANASMIKMT